MIKAPITPFRNDGIDLLRGISIISVILLHINIRIPLDLTVLGFPSQVNNIVFRSGYYGVIMFFVISGFLITSTTLKRWGSLKNMDTLRFYQLRFARIAPCLVALISLLSVLHLANVESFVIMTTSLKQAIFAALTFHINWLEANTGYLPGPWDVLWSLSVEEAFYIFFPLVCLLSKRPIVFYLLMVSFIAIGPFSRVMLSQNELWADHAYLSCMDGIAIGCLAALFANKYKLNRKLLFIFSLIGPSLMLLVLVFRKLAFQMGLVEAGLNVTALQIGTALILICLFERFSRKTKKGGYFSAPLRWFGINSYEIYLTHSFVVILMTQYLQPNNMSYLVTILWYMLILAISGILGQWVAAYFSTPMNNLLKRAVRQNIGSPQRDII